MKWKNVDIGAGYYYITGTITEWLPLLKRADLRKIVCLDIDAALTQCGGSLTAFVIMPDHLHMLVYLPEQGLLHKFCKIWRGRSGRRIPGILKKQGDTQSLKIMAAHANGGCHYAAWKEQVRALAIWSKPKLYEKISYIHANPVRRGLVTELADWPHSSYRYYEHSEQVCLPVVSIDC